MKLNYDTVGDILYLQYVAPNAAQRVREVSEGVLVRLKADSGAIEGYEVQGLRARSGEATEILLPELVSVARRSATA